MRVLNRCAAAAAVISLAMSAAAGEPPQGWTDASTSAQERYVSPDGKVIVLVSSLPGDPSDPGAALQAHIDRSLGHATASPLKIETMGRIVGASAGIIGDEIPGSKGVYILHAMGRPGQPIRLVTIMPQGGEFGDNQAGLAALLSGVSDAAARAEPVDPVGTAKVRGVVHDFGKKRYNSFSGLWTFGEEAIWLVYEDGWAMKDPGLPLSAAEAKRSRRAEPDRWVRIGDEPRLAKASVLPPLPKGATLALKVGRPNTTGAPGTSTVQRYGLVLSKDGRFETSFSGLASGGWERGEKVAERQDRVRGTYEIDGTVITLRFDDGRVTQQLFATDGKSRAVLGERYYFD